MARLTRHLPSSPPTARDLLRIQENMERALEALYAEVTELEWQSATDAGMYASKIWSDNGGTMQVVQVAKDATGRVWMRGTAGFGLLTAAIFATPSTILNLPAGAVPASDRSFVVNSNGGAGILWIYGKGNSKAGQAVLTVGTQGIVSFDGISFEAGA